MLSLTLSYAAYEGEVMRGAFAGVARGGEVAPGLAQDGEKGEHRRGEDARADQHFHQRHGGRQCAR